MRNISLALVTDPNAEDTRLDLSTDVIQQDFDDHSQVDIKGANSMISNHNPFSDQLTYLEPGNSNKRGHQVFKSQDLTGNIMLPIKSMADENNSLDSTLLG